MTRRAEILSLVTLCAALFASSLLAFTRHNTFPYYCHHDEHRKVKQLLTRDFNFNHPQMLLLTTDVVRRARGQVDGYQRVTMSGRRVSATFAATSVVLLALLGWRTFGLLGAWCVGLLVAVCPILGLTAHFLKEDTALILGLSASLLALAFYRERPTIRRLIWLGLACGLAASAKYIGVVCLLAAVAVTVATPVRAPSSWRRRFAALLLPAMLVFVAINFPLFGQLGSFFSGLNKGVVLAVQGRAPVDLPNLRVIRSMAGLSWPVMFVAGVGVLTLVARYRRTCTAGWALLGAGTVFTGMLLLSPLGVPDRYLLVPAVSLHALAGLAIAMLVEIVARGRDTRVRRTARLAGAVTAVGLVWVAFPVYRSMALDAFEQADARAELIAWVNETLSEEEVVASRDIRLPGVGFEPADPALQFNRPPTGIRNGRSIEASDLDDMRRRGVTHLILSESELWQHLARSKSQAPEVVWLSSERFKSKNRWLREKLVVLRL